MTLFTVTHKDDSVSLRNFIKDKFSTYSTREIERLLSRNGCEVNKMLQRFGSTKLKEGDQIKVMSSFLEKKSTEKLEIPILFRDEDFLVIDKPAGLSSNLKDLEPHFQETLYLVHRLDKNTTGALILALNPNAQKEIEKLFFNREIQKTYLALTHGRVPNSSGEIDQPLALKKRYEGGVIYKTTRYGKQALTRYTRLALSKAESLVELMPITGRTHQIRVHLSSIGHPILGDAIYTEKSISNYRVPHLLLHARKIQFTHPITGKNVIIIAPIPSVMKRSISTLFKKQKLCGF